MVLLWISEEEGGIWVEDARGLEVSLRDAKVALRRSLLPSLLTLELEENAEEKEDGTGGKKLGILVSLRLGFLWIALSLGWQKRPIEGGEFWMLITGRGLPVRALETFEFLRREYCSRKETDAGETTGN